MPLASPLFPQHLNISNRCKYYKKRHCHNSINNINSITYRHEHVPVGNLATKTHFAIAAIFAIVLTFFQIIDDSRPKIASNLLRSSDDDDTAATTFDLHPLTFNDPAQRPNNPVDENEESEE